MRTKFVSILIIVAILSNITQLPTYAENIQTVDQTAAIAAYGKLWDTFTKVSLTEIVYPDEYGGEYLDGEILYIYIVGLTDEIADKYMEIMGNPSCVEFLNAEYSLNYLESLNKIVKNHVNDGLHNITGYGVDRRNNRFSIELATENTSTGIFSSADIYLDNNAKMLEQELTNPAIVLSSGSYLEPAVSLMGGSSLTGYNSSNQLIGSFSLCIGGTYTTANSSVPAILTAGHCVSDRSGNLNVSTVKFGNAIIGTPEAALCNFELNGVGDYAIIKVTSTNYTPTNDILNGSSVATNITAVQPYSIEGMAITQYGALSGEHTAEVIAVNHTHYFRGEDDMYYIGGLVQVAYDNDVLPDAGDSGGPIYIKGVTGTTGTILGSYTGGCIYDDCGATDIKYNYWGAYSPIMYPLAAGFIPATS